MLLGVNPTSKIGFCQQGRWTKSLTSNGLLKGRVGVKGRRHRATTCVAADKGLSSKLGVPVASTVSGKSNRSKSRLHHVDPGSCDLNFWHYQPWWLQPPTVVGFGAAFILGANLMEGFTLKTTILAAGPVALLWGIFFFLLPRQFKSFATEYLETHDIPEEELQ